MVATLSARTAVPTCAAAHRAAARPAAGKSFFSGRVLRADVAVAGRGCRRVTAMKVEYDQVGSAYAAALLDLAKDKDLLEAVHTDVDSLQALMKSDPKLGDFLTNPVVPAKKRKEILKTVAQKAQLNEVTVNFVSLLIDNDRLVAYAEIFDSFEQQYCNLTDTQVATLRSAVPLQQEQQFLIAKKLQELTKAKNIKLKPVIDESLIGGFIVEFGSSQIDLSIKGKVAGISKELKKKAALAV
eukprot:jgi/Botrbrau1/8363/Bobra.0046s0024.1